MAEKISDVYFTDMRTAHGSSLLDKLGVLIDRAGFGLLDLEGKFSAIKIHFGEPGNLSYLRPNYVSVVSDIIRRKKGIPFLSDANTLYVGERANAVEHLSAAEKNGFVPAVTGCPVIIADGLRGTDYREVEISLTHCETAKIGTVIADADVIISMNHVKGHEMTGFGGAIKNIGMGSGSRGGKLEMHSSSKPFIKQKKCVSCGQCINYCSRDAISFNVQKKASIDYELCIGCGQCVAVCRYRAASLKWNEAAETATEKISEYAYAVLKGKDHFHINFIIDVSPNCDCVSHNDMPVVPNIGILASFDPVAADQASMDLVNNAPALKGSVLDNPDFSRDSDKFTSIYPYTNWKSGISHAVRIGLGSDKYNLVKI